MAFTDVVRQLATRKPPVPGAPTATPPPPTGIMSVVNQLGAPKPAAPAPAPMVGGQPAPASSAPQAPQITPWKPPVLYGQPMQPMQPQPDVGGGGTIVPPPVPGQPPPSTGGVSEFGPGNDLQYTEFAPEASDRLQGYQGQLDRYATGLEEGPDRGKLASDIFSQVEETSRPEYERQLQDVGRKASALGRIGAGMTTSELGDVQSNREKYLGNIKRSLASEAAGASLSDRLARLGAQQGLVGQQYGQEAGRREELRGERGYEHAVAGEPYRQELERKALEDQLLNSAFGRQATAAQIGLQAGELYGQQAGEAGQATGDLLEQMALERGLNQYYGGGSSPSASPEYSGGGGSPGFELPSTQLPEQNMFIDPMTGRPYGMARSYQH
jgi:hypothetical protein